MILCVARYKSFHHEIIWDGSSPSLKYLLIMCCQSEGKADNVEARPFASQSFEHRYRVFLMLWAGERTVGFLRNAQNEMLLSFR